mmetsp:Transcript_18950/g.54954  ORF Transcript_18950/g.54954 Transcript_18950/m.54954 type:complete len:289 (+) Transcript_18950:310-1176(+)
MSSSFRSLGVLPCRSAAAIAAEGEGRGEYSSTSLEKSIFTMDGLMSGPKSPSTPPAPPITAPGLNSPPSILQNPPSPSGVRVRPSMIRSPRKEGEGRNTAGASSSPRPTSPSLAAFPDATSSLFLPGEMIPSAGCLRRSSSCSRPRFLAELSAVPLSPSSSSSALATGEGLISRTVMAVIDMSAMVIPDMTVEGVSCRVLPSLSPFWESPAFSLSTSSSSPYKPSHRILTSEKKDFFLFRPPSRRRLPLPMPDAPPHPEMGDKATSLSLPSSSPTGTVGNAPKWKPPR